nr:hypothetical protein B0A51_11507 [Rachicladosporium sp. CCFEE 5018]
MHSIRRAVPRTARQFRQPLRQPHRRFDSHSSHPPSTPVNESFGAGFYITLTAIPILFLTLNYTGAGSYDTSSITRLITDTYNGYEEKWAQRNDVHTQMIEQAASDRVLFLNEASAAVRHVDLRFPEIFNTGSPYNVPAGHGSANIDQLIAKYQKESNEAQEEKLEQLRSNRVPREQPVKDFAKITPAAVDS